MQGGNAKFSATQFTWQLKLMSETGSGGNRNVAEVQRSDGCLIRANRLFTAKQLKYSEPASVARSDYYRSLHTELAVNPPLTLQSTAQLTVERSTLDIYSHSKE